MTDQRALKHLYRLAFPIIGALGGLLVLLGILTTELNAAVTANAAAPATIITVTTTADEFGTGAGCGLREAIQAANINAAFGGCAAGTVGADTIRLPAGTYTITRNATGEDRNALGDLDVLTDTAGIFLIGTGATSATVVINANGVDRALHALVAISLSNLTLRGGNGGYGGGALFEGLATVTNVTFSGNSANIGGGAYFFSTASVSRTTFVGNQAGDQGGGAYFDSTAYMSDTTFLSNTSGLSVFAVFGGGGAYFRGPASVTGTAFSNNVVALTYGAFGGGGAYFSNTASVTNSLFSGNRAAYGGGAYFDTPTASQLANVLFAHNRATTQGAAVYVLRSASLQLMHATIVSPTAPTGATDAIHVSGGTVYLTNTLIASHTVGLERVGGTVRENYTLFSSVTTPYSGSVVSGGNSLTGTAGFYNTAWYTLTNNSVAINTGTNAGVTVDFFGDARPQDAGYDIGYDEGLFVSVYTLTPTAGAGGSIAPSTPQTVNYGSSLTFTITPNTGYTVTNVFVDSNPVGPLTTYVFTNITSSHTIQAIFNALNYTLTIGTAGNGSGVVTPTTGIYTYTYGTVVTLTATANTGSTFSGWGGACSGTGSCGVTMTANRSVTAAFATNKLYLPFIWK